MDFNLTMWTAELVCFRIIRNFWTTLKGEKSLFFLIKETEYHLIHSWGDGNPHEQPQTDLPPPLLLKISHLTHSCLKLWAPTRSHTHCSSDEGYYQVHLERKKWPLASWVWGLVRNMNLHMSGSCYVHVTDAVSSDSNAPLSYTYTAFVSVS